MPEDRNELKKKLLSKKESELGRFGKFSTYPHCKHSESMFWRAGLHLTIDQIIYAETLPVWAKGVGERTKWRLLGFDRTGR